MTGIGLFSSLRGYQRDSLRPDMIAAATVWAVLVPEALAYATIAGAGEDRRRPRALERVFGTDSAHSG
jgi:hypothetical protein